MKTLTWQKPGQQNVAQELIKIIINYVAELRINNLISNAFKYTKAGGTISIAVRKRNQEVLIEITDNGSGIAEKDIDKIFNRFYQADIDSPSPVSYTHLTLPTT